MEFNLVLQKVKEYSESLGFNIVINNEIDRFYKGDLDGKNIYITELSSEENLFNVLHMVGHSIQWNISDELRELGNVIHKNPSDELLRKLQEYEFEANCYGLEILHKVGYGHLYEWLDLNFRIDILYLTHFYKTGEKLREVTSLALKHVFDKELFRKNIPSFTIKSQDITRNGIVINFTN